MLKAHRTQVYVMKVINATPFLIFASLMLYGGPSHAYLDPGSGSLLLQVLLGGIAGLLVAGKLMWSRILGLFGIHGNDSTKISDENED